MANDLPTLRALLASLREAQASGVLSKAPALKTKDVERDEYLESAVRDVAGRTDGAQGDSPAVGGAREGSAVGAIGKEEVGAIEKIAGDLSGPPSRRDEEGDTKMADG